MSRIASRGRPDLLHQPLGQVCLQEIRQRIANHPLLPPIAVGLHKTEQEILNQLHPTVCRVVAEGGRGKGLAGAGICCCPFQIGVMTSEGQAGEP